MIACALSNRHLDEGISPISFLRRKIRALLATERPEAVIEAFPPSGYRGLVSPLISLFYEGDARIRDGAIAAFGLLLARIADEDMEAARVVMRRLMWSLNDESGGIGWGAPVAMGEAMAQHQGLAEEYAPILLSYIREDGNYLELPALRMDALRGIVRLAGARPHILRSLDARKHIEPCLASEDPEERRLAESALSRL